MRTNDHLQRNSRIRQLGGASSLAVDESPSTLISDAKLFAMTFAAGFLFMTIFLA